MPKEKLSLDVAIGVTIPARDARGRATRIGPVLDEILKLEIEGGRLAAWERAEAEASVQKLVATPEGAALVARIRGLIAKTEYKRRQAPPIIRVRARAFGSGRQMPIAAFHA